jgi:hypothetical protein
VVQLLQRLALYGSRGTHLLADSQPFLLQIQWLTTGYTWGEGGGAEQQQQPAL